jgi:competence protein ComGC
MDHRENVSARPDFAKILAKMPQGYTRISYTDVGACFSNGLACAQFLTDLPVMLLKISAKSDETFKFPIALNEFWGMDPGRFPPEALMREKLFGAVAVTVPQPDGWLYENFSPIGPIPLPTAPTGFQNQVATMSILAGMLLPALARAREAARAASCKANLAQIAKALVAYEMAHNQNMPSSLADLLPQYLAQPRVLICPNDQAPMVIRNGMKCSYRYIGNVPEKDSWSDLFIVYDHAVDEGGRNVVHYDGFISFYSEEEFHRTLAEQYEKFKPILARPDFPGDRDRVKAFFEDKDFPEK